jgi:hypothetical protein
MIERLQWGYIKLILPAIPLYVIRRAWHNYTHTAAIQFVQDFYVQALVRARYKRVMENGNAH